MNPYDDPQHAPHAVQRCIDDLQSPNPRQRSQAAEELGKLRDPVSVPHLIEHVQEDVNTYVRSAAAEALGHLGDPAAIFPLMDALHDPCSFVRRAAAIALGQMQAKEAQGALLQALDDPNFYVRRAAINAIGKLGIPDMGSVLLSLLETPDPRIRRTVVIALRRLQARQAIPTMITMLEEYMTTPTQRDLPVVKTLVVALGDLRAANAVPVLIRVVRGYVGVRSLAAKALGQIGDLQAGPVLVEALSDRSANLQLAALKSIGRLRYREALPAVRKFLDVSDPRLRRFAALTLGMLDEASVVPVLSQMAHEDPSPLVRPAAIEALRKVGGPELVPQLLPLVDDTNAYVRASLACTLATLDPASPAVQQALRQLTKDKVEHVVHAAQRALKDCEENATAPKSEMQEVSESQETERKPVSWLKRFLGRV